MFKKESFKKYFVNTSWLVLEKVLRGIVTLAITVYVTRYLGPSQYGLLSYSYSFVTLFIIFATLGLDDIVIRELIHTPAKRDVLLGTAFRLKLIGALLIMIILAVLLAILPRERLTHVLCFIIAVSFIFQSFNVIDLYFQSNVLSKYVVFCQIFQLILSTLIKLVLILVKASLVWFAFMFVLDGLFRAVGLIFVYCKKGLSLPWKEFDLHLAKKLLKNAFPFILGGLFGSIYMKIDQVMIKQMLDNAAVGVYAAAVNLCEVWYYIPIIITNSVYPAILNAKMSNENIYYNRLQNLFDLMAFTSICIGLLITFAASPIVKILYGNGFYEASQVARIYVWAGIGIFLGAVTGKLLVAENQQIYLLYLAILAAITNVVLNFLFIPRYGIVGAAWATLAGYSMIVFGLIFFARTRKIFFMVMKSLFPFGRISLFAKKG